MRTLWVSADVAVRYGADEDHCFCVVAPEDARRQLQRVLDDPEEDPYERVVVVKEGIVDLRGFTRDDAYGFTRDLVLIKVGSLGAALELREQFDRDEEYEWAHEYRHDDDLTEVELYDRVCAREAAREMAAREAAQRSPGELAHIRAALA